MNITSAQKRRVRSALGTARKDFTNQRVCAKRRGIGWELSFEQWCTIWESSGHWEGRGRGGNAYCMCRRGDVGPYAIGNVFIATSRENSSDTPKKKSGLPIGVRKSFNCKNFRAERRINGKRIDLGSHRTPDLAHAAYLRAASPLFLRDAT